jgi:Transglycosylase SLT domain
MRPILVLAILLVGLKGAVPETRYHDALPDIGAYPLPSSFELAAPIGKSDSNFVVAIPPLESSDAAHDQGEAAAEPPSALAPSGNDPGGDAETADSIDGLCQALMTSAQDNGLPVAFFANLIWQESHLQHDAVSPVGALGIAQFMPSVAEEVGVLDPFDPRQAIPASARFLRTLREHFGNLGFVAAAYNAGARRVGEWLDHHRALPLETRNYVLRVTGLSVEAWRKAPVDDSELTFVRPLPCRDLPAFADLEQAQLRVAEQIEQARQSQSQQQKPAATLAATPLEPAAAKAAHKTPAARRAVAARKAATKAAATEAAAAKAGRKTPAARGVVADRKPEARGTGVIARNLHAGHEAAHRQHAPHEKRRVA